MQFFFDMILCQFLKSKNHSQKYFLIVLNKISLKVGGKLVAAGELVIINDRFGVKINNISAQEEAEVGEVINVQEEVESSEGNSEEDFDYSDFEVEDGSEE